MSVKIIAGDCREVLRTLPDANVHCCVTSPPYYGLRDYGVAEQMGLDFTHRPRRNRVSYFNTTGLTWRDLSDAKGSARTQDVLVLSFFRARTPTMAPSEVWCPELET